MYFILKIGHRCISLSGARHIIIFSYNIQQDKALVRTE